MTTQLMCPPPPRVTDDGGGAVDTMVEVECRQQHADDDRAEDPVSLGRRYGLAPGDSVVVDVTGPPSKLATS